MVLAVTPGLHTKISSRLKGARSCIRHHAISLVNPYWIRQSGRVSDCFRYARARLWFRKGSRRIRSFILSRVAQS